MKLENAFCFTINISLILFFILIGVQPNSAWADKQAVLFVDQDLWKDNTYLCEIALPAKEESSAFIDCPGDDVTCFPGEAVGPDPDRPSCGDGDMTLFNALLCYANVQEGCAAVPDAQNTITGQWHRSPRLRAYPRLRKSNSFSPDQALGVLLWAASNPSSNKNERLSWWLEWVLRNRRCASEGCENKVARFCPDDDIDGDPEAAYGCTMRPGDLATLGIVMRHLRLRTSDAKFNTDLELAADRAIPILVLSAQVTEPGYPLHLVAVTGLIYRSLRIDDDLIDKSLKLIYERQPNNPFFAWLAGASSDLVSELTLKYCPASVDTLPPPNRRRDWIWQREETDEAWNRTMVWDCRFMAGLLRDGL